MHEHAAYATAASVGAMVYLSVFLLPTLVQVVQ